MTTNDADRADEILALIRSHAELFDTEHQAVIATRLDGQIVHWNRAAERLYGWTSSEVQGRLITDVTPSEEAVEEGREIMSKLQVGRSWSGLFTVRSKAGVSFKVLVRDIPIKDDRGELVGIIGISSRGLA